MNRLENFCVGFFGMLILCVIIGVILATTKLAFTTLGPMVGVSVIIFWAAVIAGIAEASK